MLPSAPSLVTSDVVVPRGLPLPPCPPPSIASQAPLDRPAANVRTATSPIDVRSAAHETSRADNAYVLLAARDVRDVRMIRGLDDIRDARDVRGLEDVHHVRDG